jgi:menaquinone-dependent protoporphyrinogen oxidase
VRERILIAYGSKRGSTAEIALAIGETLRARDHDVDVLNAADVVDVLEYDAVVLGGSVQHGKWHRQARRFARRFAGDLMMTPVWAFSSGPLDWSADQMIVSPVATVQKAIDMLDVRGHMTFGGCEAVGRSRRLRRDLPAAGDFRNFERITAWASDIGVELGTPALHLLAI